MGYKMQKNVSKKRRRKLRRRAGKKVEKRIGRVPLWSKESQRKDKMKTAIDSIRAAQLFLTSSEERCASLLKADRWRPIFGPNDRDNFELLTFTMMDNRSDMQKL